VRLHGDFFCAANKGLTIEQERSDESYAYASTHYYARFTRWGSLMTIRDFAEIFRVRVRRDGCGDEIIPGTLRAEKIAGHSEYLSHIYGHGDGRLGVLLMFKTKRRWGNARRKLAGAEFEIRQDGDTEGTALFDPSNAAQAGLALKLARIRRRPELTQEQRQKLLDRLANARELRRSPEKPPVQAKFSTRLEETGQMAVVS
jgi:hypothetical protein